VGSFLSSMAVWLLGDGKITSKDYKKRAVVNGCTLSVVEGGVDSNVFTVIGLFIPNALPV
jgi:hypothetical protein